MNIVQFTLTEDDLLNRVDICIMKAGKLLEVEREELLGTRLADWRFWINDPVLYLHELKNLVEDLEKKFSQPSKPKRKRLNIS